MRELHGRIRYDKDSDSFVYEIRTVINDEFGEWGMCCVAPCVRREGADDGEEANFVHYSFIKQIVKDVSTLGVRLVG